MTLREKQGQGGGRSGRRGPRALWMALAVSGLLALEPGRASNGGGDPLASLKVGHWVQLEGLVQAESTATCDELRILTGDFLDDDWSMRAYAEAIDTVKHEIRIGGLRAHVAENTAFDGPPGFRRLADLRTGMLIEVEGTYLRNRRFLALEVDDESDEIGRPPWPRNRIRIVAKVEHVDARKHMVTAMGFVFQLTDKTRVRSVIE